MDASTFNPSARGATPPRRLSPPYCKLQVRWLHSVTRITDRCKRIGILSFAALLPFELFRV
ncbi:hypothetical protein CLM71_09440 [Serratia sp. MYb239]|nr:hypothetical protein CLM71_09440 [Serratia sp. MYb239]